MAPASGARAGKPSLSSLQATLRKGAPAGTDRRAAVSDSNSSIVGGAGSSLKRTAPSARGQAPPPPPPKRRVSAASLQEVDSAPATATTSAVAAVCGEGTPVTASAAQANLGPFAKTPSEVLRRPEHDTGGDASTSSGPALGGQGTLVPEWMHAAAALGTARRGTQLRHVVRLAEAFGRTLPVDHINHFLRALKKKLVERAQQEGVRVQVVKASSSRGNQQQPSMQSQETQAQRRAVAVPSSTAAATVASALPDSTKQPGAVSKHPGNRHGVAGARGSVSMEIGAPRTAAGRQRASWA